VGGRTCANFSVEHLATILVVVLSAVRLISVGRYLDEEGFCGRMTGVAPGIGRTGCL